MLSVYVNKEDVNDTFISIKNEKEIRHIVNVFRLGIGENLRVFDGEFEYLCNISKISKKEVLVKIENKNEDIYNLNIRIDLAIGIIKNDKMNLLIQKLTELGVSNIIPLMTKRVVVKLNEKKEKWDEVVIQAMKQCKAIKKTNVLSITKLKDIDYKKYDKVIYFYENSNNNLKITDVIDKIDKNILVIIGPEGGFCQEEVDYLSNFGVELSLGTRILRAETAAISACSVLAHIYG